MPSHRFGIVDNVVDAPNVASVMFREEEGSFLMGLIAARNTRSRVVGFIGGMSVPVIEHFEAGYRAGIRAVDPAINVITVYSGTFTDPGRGSRDATAVMDRGADVIFHAAGNTGVGVIDAVRAHNRFVIGVDRDQSALAPQHVLSSMLKRVDAATFEISQATQTGHFPGGRTTMLGLRENGVGYSPTTLWARMPPGTRELVDRWADAIRTGRVTVPNTMAQLRTWTVPSL